MGQRPVTGAALGVAELEADFEAEAEVLELEPEECDWEGELKVLEITAFFSTRGKGITSRSLCGDETCDIE